MSDKKIAKPSIKTVIGSIFRLYGFTKEYYKWGFIRLLGGFASGSFSVLSAYLGGRMVGVAISGDKSQLINYAVISLGAIIGRSLLGIVNEYTNAYYNIYSGKKLRILAMEKINKLPIAYYENKHTGETISKLVSDIEKLQEFFGNSMAGMWSYVPSQFIASLIILICVDAKLTLICCIIIPLFGFALNKINVPVGKHSETRQEHTAKYNSYLRDLVEGIQIYKAYGMDETHSHKFESACEDYAKSSFKIAARRSFSLAVSIFGMILPQIIAVGVGSIFVINGSISLEELFIFTGVLWPFLSTFRMISGSWTSAIEEAGRADHLFKLYDAELERIDGENFTNIDASKMIEFEKVNYSYYESVPLLKDISFCVNKGQKIAIVGASGCGKTTIHKLLVGFYSNYKGKIKIMDNEVSKWNLEDLRSNISAVNQDIYLFDASIMDNIRFGKPDATDDQVKTAAQNAYANEFILNTKEGYNTIIGERGVSLSGGQRQRIAVARAILRNAPIVLLDEPTSALDTKAEYYVQKSLESLEEGKTVLIIAHRLSTIENSDLIVVIHEGKVCGIDKHEKLLVNNEQYRALYMRQVSNEKGVS